MTAKGWMQLGQVASLHRLTCLNRYLKLALGFLHTCMVKDEPEVNKSSLSLKSKQRSDTQNLPAGSSSFHVLTNFLVWHDKMIPQC